MQHNLSDHQLSKIARENYSILSRYCSILLEEGYWDEPYKILGKPIQQILDLYIQSCLIEVAIDCSNSLNQAQLQLLATLTDTNPYDITSDGMVSNDVLQAAKRFVNAPPILLQLVGMRDTKTDKSLGGLFFDAILNILLVMVYLSKVAAAVYMKCLQEYCANASVFIRNASNKATIVDEKYLFKKICVQDLSSSTKSLKDAGEDFVKYKENTLFYRDKRNHTVTEHSQKKLAFVQEAKAESMTEAVDAKLLQTIKTTNQEERLNELMLQLNELVGLEEVKKEIYSLINLIKVRKLRERYHLPDMEMSYHMVFSGNPGTGKTTVARLVAEIYKELGLLSKGTLIETDRSGLVAGYVGQTAIKVKEVVERAIGGVLFIDEAYSLTSAAGSNDFGTEAIDTLVKLMEDNRDDLVVIVAGYTEEMKQFLSSNTGLISRFNKFIEFRDYSQQELIDILLTMAKHSGFVVSDEAQSMVKQYLENMKQQTKMLFGNARGIRNLFERLVVIQANRVVTYEIPSVEQLTHIEKDDVALLIQE